MTTRTARRAARTRPALLLCCCVLAQFALPATARAADVVITNTPNGVSGGSGLDDSRFKSLVFTTGSLGGQVRSLGLGLNPAEGTVAPVTQRLEISLWSVGFDGTDYTPSARLAGTGLLPVTLTGTGGIFDFDDMATDGGFFLEANTTYALTLASDATGIRWGNTGTVGLGTATTPTALGGYLFRTFVVSLDGGLTWAASSNFNTLVLTVDQGIHPGSVAYASNPYYAAFNGGTLLVDVAGSFATDYDTGTGGVIDGNGLRSVFSGVFSGAGSLAFTNSTPGGAIELSGRNTYTGATRVGAGATLVVNGSLAASSGLSVDAGGAVQGNGSLPQTRLVTGARLAPGNSIGTLALGGLALNGGTLDLEFQGPRHDRLTVSGQVTDFFGTARLVASGGGPWPHFVYPVLAALNSAPFANPGSLVLDPAGVPSALLRHGATLVQEVDGDARSFDLQWRPREGTGVATAAVRALRPGARQPLATAGAVDRVFRSVATAAAGNANAGGAAIDDTGFSTAQAAAAGASAGFVSAGSRLLGLATESELIAALGTLAPEPWAAFQSVGLDSLQRQRELLLGQAGLCAASEHGVRTARDSCVFAATTQADSGVDGRDGLADYDAEVLVSVFGVEDQLAARWTVGAAYGHGSAGLEDMAPGNGRIDAETNGASVYGVYRPAPALSLRSLVGYSRFDVDGSRQVAFIGNGAALTADTDADAYTVAFDAAYRLTLTAPDARTPAYLEPVLGVAWDAYRQAGFRERGANGLNLAVDDHTAHSVTGSLGLALTTAPLALGAYRSATLTPRLALGYQLDALGDDADVKSLRASFIGTPAAGVFDTWGENRGQHALSVDGGAELKLAERASLFASFGYERFDTGSRYSCAGGLRLVF